MPKTSKKYKTFSRPAVDRGIPVEIVDCLIAICGADEADITFDSLLQMDLRMDDLDIVELAGDLEAKYRVTFEDACLDWLRVDDVVHAVKKAQSRKAVAS